MSRAMNVNLSIADTLAACETKGAKVSSIVGIWSGGTRVVLTNSHDSAVMAKAFKGELIDGSVQMAAPKRRGTSRSIGMDTPRETAGWNAESGGRSARTPIQPGKL